MKKQISKAEKLGVGILERIGLFAQRRSGWVILGTPLLTLLLLIPILTMAPTEGVADNPGGEGLDL